MIKQAIKLAQALRNNASCDSGKGSDYVMWETCTPAQIHEILALAREIIEEHDAISEMYLHDRGVKCPSCGGDMASSRLVADPIEQDRAYADARCGKCRFHGKEIWELVGIEDETMPEGKG